MSINQNDSLAFKKFTNNRYKIVYTGDDGAGVLQMTPGLTAEELVGILAPVATGYGMICTAFPEPDRDVIDCAIAGSDVLMYYIPKNGKITGKADKVPELLPTEG